MWQTSFKTISSRNEECKIGANIYNTIQDIVHLSVCRVLKQIYRTFQNLAVMYDMHRCQKIWVIQAR